MVVREKMRNRLNILLIDDDEEEYLIIKDLIERSSTDFGHTSFHLDWVENYAKALEAYEKDFYDAYLVDYHLGDHTGLDLMQEATVRGCKGPVILLTGQGNYQVDLAAMEAGAADYLVKDELNLPLLERSIRYAIEQKQAQDQLEELVQKRTVELVRTNRELQSEIRLRKRVEVVLQESEEKFRTLANTTSAAIFIVQDFYIRYANPAVKYVTGYDAEELVGKMIWKIIHPDYKHVWKHYGLANGWTDKYPTRYELKILTTEGEERWVDMSAGIMEFEGKPAYVITAFDITERDLAERELRQAKEQLEMRVADRTEELRQANIQLSLTALRAERQAEEMAAVFDSMAEAVTVFDEQATLLNANRIATDILGADPIHGKKEDLHLVNSLRNIDGTPLERRDSPVLRALRGETVRGCLVLMDNARGQEIFASVSSAPLYSGSRISGVVAVWQDITERQHLMEKLEEEQAKLRKRVVELDALHNATSALMNTLDIDSLLSEIVDAAQSASTGSERGMLHLTFDNPESAPLLLGKPSSRNSEPPGLFSFLSSENSPKNVYITEGLVGYLAKVVCEKQSLIIPDVTVDSTFEINNSGKEMQDFLSLIAAPLLLGEDCIGSLSLVSSKKSAFTKGDLWLLESFAATASAAIHNASLYAEVQRLSMTDPLTELFNRRGLFVVGSREIEHARRFKRPVSALLLDIDHFKPINDTYGHSVGDQVLKELARTLRDLLRRSDVLARYGGEEFAILLPEIHLQNAKDLAERIRETIEKTPFETSVGQISITVSLGAAETLHCGLDLVGLLECADQALYIAKNNGRNRVETIQ
jgi:diguanylate cyclase (GGDEF)-like protein/PAS domain S-box-containing protein